MFKKVIKVICFWLINHIFIGTHFFEIKNGLCRACGVEIGKNSKIVGPINLKGDLSVGNNCWIGCDFNIYGNGKVTICDNCDVAPQVTILTGSHNMGDMSRRAGKGYNKNVQIGSGCWICSGVRILPGVVIGNSSVIAAGAVVTKNVPENVLVAGVPCEIKKKLN